MKQPSLSWQILCVRSSVALRGLVQACDAGLATPTHHLYEKPCDASNILLYHKVAAITGLEGVQDYMYEVPLK